VLGATVSMLTTAWKVVPGDIEWNHTIEDSQTSLYRMTRELRQGTNLTIISGYRFSADVVLAGQTQHVLWQCDIASTCTRKSTVAPAAAPAQGAGGTTMIGNVQNASLSPAVPMFTQPTTNYFQVVLKVKSTGSVAAATSKRSHTITFTDGFYGRNA
jgi:hypothetical protein